MSTAYVKLESSHSPRYIRQGNVIRLRFSEFLADIVHFIN